MKRTPMQRRTPLRSKAPPPRPVKTIEGYTPRPRAVAVAVRDESARMAVPVPKFAYVRDERLRDMCRAMRCQHCDMGGADAGVTWAHSNQGIHGKAGAIKASDVYVAALCWWCHREVDQGGRLTQEEKVSMWTLAHLKTIAEAVRRGLWPKGIDLPSHPPIPETAAIPAAPTKGASDGHEEDRPHAHEVARQEVGTADEEGQGLLT